MKLIWSYIRKHLLFFSVAIFFLALESMADLFQPFFMAQIVDRGVADKDTQAILKFGGIMLLIAILGAVSSIIRSIISTKTSQTIAKELRSDIYTKVNSLSIENIDKLDPASIVTRATNDVNNVQEFISGTMRFLLKMPIMGIGAIVLLVMQTPAQIPVIAVILLVVSVFVVLNMKLGYPRFSKIQSKLDRLNVVSREFLSSVRVVKAFNAEDDQEQKFAEASGELATTTVGAMRIMAIFSPLINLTVNFGIIVLLWISRNQNPGEIGKLMASINYMTQILFALGMVTHILNFAVRATASSERISEIFDEVPAQSEVSDPVELAKHEKIIFDKVYFKYAGAADYSLEDISFEVEAGKTLGIIGPTGSGKTTLANVLLRFYDVSSGSISFDGLDINQIAEKSLRQGVAVVPQRALLFSGSVAENISWGKADAVEDEVRAAAEIASADRFVQAMSEGYDTWLEQGGVNLSGGQRQRISIARAIVKKPDVLILDDCTSALDARTEAGVLESLRNELSETTTFLISQKISTVMKADYILCLEDGKMQGFGSHEELLKTSHTYRAIYDSQIGGGYHV